MKINYFFPIFFKENIKDFFDNFVKSKNYQKYCESSKIIFVCCKKDKNNIEYLESQFSNKELYKIICINKEFNYNDAFKAAIKYFDGDFILLGDTKISKIDIIFDKCIEKKKEKINLIHVVKKRTKFKGFVFNLLGKIYNFFIKIFTGKFDRLNVISLGLIDKNIIDVLKHLPNKCCFLKNTKQLRGFESRTIYIDEKIETSKLNYKQKTSCLISSFIALCLFILSVFLTIMLNIFIDSDLFAYNIISFLFIFICLISICIFIPKHIFDIRNRENRNINYKVEERN